MTEQKKIAVADDEDFLIEMTIKVLSKRGFEIVSYSTGEGLLNDLSKVKPCLVILDHYFQEGRKGTEICHAIKSSDETKDIPVIMATGQALLKDPCGGDPRHKRADAFLIKPFTIEELVSKVETLTSVTT